MPTVYKIIFGSTTPRINEDLRVLLQNLVELIGDWFCYKYFTVIRVYDFEGKPYKLPKFLTRRIFSLEYLRQRLCAENDIFIKHKKVSSINFKFTLEPFIVELVTALTVIDKIMKSMCFHIDQSLGYDPKKIIHQRKLVVNMSGYEAEEDEVLAALANSDFLEQVEDNGRNGSDSNMVNPDKDVTEQRTEVPTPLKGEKSLKRHSIDTVDMDIDVSNKKAKTSTQPI